MLTTVAPAPLERVAHASGVVFYRSALLHGAGFLHGFSTRHGGVSAEPFDTMNLGIAVAPGEPDSDANVARNAALLMAAIGALHARMVRVRQVHRADVHCCGADAAFGPPVVEADAVVAVDAGVAPCVRTADCVPVLLACPRTRVVAAVHAGWRGIVGGVIARGVAALVERGSRREDVLAAIGPCIGVNAYEVGEEVAQEFWAADLGAFVARKSEWTRPHLDCFGAVRAQLQSAGLSAVSVDGRELCTASESRGPAAEFFSYRRDGARSGRMGAVIVAG